MLTGLLLLGTVLLLVLSPLRGLEPVPPMSDWQQIGIAALIVALSAAAVVAPVSFHHRGSTYLFSLGQIPVLLGLVFAQPQVLVLSRVLGQGIGYGVVRRQPPVKLAFNMASAAFTAVIADLAYREILGHRWAAGHWHSLAGPWGWLAGATALGLAELVMVALVALAVRLYGQRQRRSSSFQAAIWTLATIAAIALAFVVLDAACQPDPEFGVLPLVLVAGLIVFAYRGYLRLTNRFGALQQLYDFGSALSNPDSETLPTSWMILEQVQSVMRSGRAELVLSDRWPIGTRMLLADAGRSIDQGLVLDESPLLRRAILDRRAMLHVAAPDPGEQAPKSDPVLGSFRDALVAPLSSGDRVVGALVALRSLEEINRFDDDDLRLFEALAAHASTTLDRARLVEQLRLEAEAKSYQALHDVLTGLPNRTLFLERATAALATTERAAVALLDVDRFKEVNDTLGHETGDRLICKVADCLVRAANNRAMVARLGGDEFAVIVTDIIGPEEALGMVRDLVEAIARPLDVDGITLAVRASAGVALAPEHGENVSKLLQRADIAMYLAKDKRSGIELYSSAQDRSMQRKLVLGGQLQDVIAAGKGLHVMYQPIAEMATGDVVRAEALVRWYHEELGLIPADEFISIAVQMGLISEITDYVLGEGCAQAALWRDRGMPIGLSVNLSIRDLSNPGLVEIVARHLDDHHLPPSALTLEVTETEVMVDLGAASNVLGQLGNLGVGVAVDDYGTGYSSLAYLHRLPLTELKIDRSLVTNVASDLSNAIIIRSSIAMAHSLGLHVTAEGAEDELTCAVLADAQCDALQGNYLSKPLTAEAMRAFLASGARLEYSPELPTLHLIPGHQPQAGGRGIGHARY